MKTRRTHNLRTREQLQYDWKPRLRGHIYCSPSCGGGCTKAAHDVATERAHDLAARLGPDWTPRVWENLGWHYSAINGTLEVSERKHGRTAHYTLNIDHAVVFESTRLTMLLRNAADGMKKRAAAADAVHKIVYVAFRRLTDR